MFGSSEVAQLETMAQIMTLRILPPIRAHNTQTKAPALLKPEASNSSTHSWTSLSHSLNCNGRISCLFSDNRKQRAQNYGNTGVSCCQHFLLFFQEQARKALEGALGGKKAELEKWNEEIKRREEAGGGGNSGGGGWFGWRRWFGGSDDGHFWQEAQQASLTILGIFVVYLIVAKGDVLLAVIFNPLLFALRGTRSVFSFLTSKITNGQNFSTPQEDVAIDVSAKDRVVGKWGGN